MRNAVDDDDGFTCRDAMCVSVCVAVGLTRVIRDSERDWVDIRDAVRLRESVRVYWVDELPHGERH